MRNGSSWIRAATIECARGGAQWAARVMVWFRAIRRTGQVVVAWRSLVSFR
jgi:hypothetical protein